MEKPINSLTFVENELEWTESRFRLFRRRQEIKVRAPIHEIYIDGLPLLALIEPSEADDPNRRIPLPWSDQSEMFLEQLKELLGGPVPADRNGRAWLLYCQCGDPGCGGLSTRISITDKTVTWSDLGWDDIFGTPTEPVEIDRTFVFERAEYEKALHALTRQFSGTSDHKL
ncbi:hypothetical protein [Arthrobacter sp. ISL-65]|uniref:hypothetical protein n=1 Tax=Arthrobacter sp. ISL-65 TaxID=2819112 RepID=UPI001BE52592|nr:hypothetical protein [Arthrobacter sp. ISL-65]MBT2550853.1 hypothetical protein [Arthrobacter sp. ISL-65]